MRRLTISILLICVITYGCSVSNSIEPTLESNSEYGGYGPLILKFNTPMQESSVEERIQIIPKVTLDFYWEGDELSIYPKVGLKPDEEYQLILKKGSLAESEEVINRDLNWIVRIHPQCIIYIGKATKSPELWRLCNGEKVPKPLTDTEGRIYDFEVSYDGNMIIFSKLNEKGGSEIWRIDRDGMNLKSILDCMELMCTDITLSADNQWLAFTREVSSAQNGGSFSKREIVIRNMVSNEEFLLLEAESLYPSELKFSPRGNYLSSYEENSKSFWIINFDTQMIDKLSSGIALGGAWTSDGNGFLFVTPQLWGGIPYDKVQLWEISNGTSKYLFGDETEQFGYFHPQWQPGGDWILVATRPLSGSPTKQLSLVSPDGSKSIPITEQQIYSNSAYSWSPDGTEIVFQRYALGDLDSIPEIGIWDMEDQEIVIIASDATRPKWLP